MTTDVNPSSSSPESEPGLEGELRFRRWIGWPIPLTVSIFILMSAASDKSNLTMMATPTMKKPTFTMGASKSPSCSTKEGPIGRLRYTEYFKNLKELIKFLNQPKILSYIPIFLAEWITCMGDIKVQNAPIPAGLSLLRNEITGIYYFEIILPTPIHKEPMITFVCGEVTQRRVLVNVRFRRRWRNSVHVTLCITLS